MLSGKLRQPDDMPDILTRCPLTGNSIKTGLDTETVRFDTLPSIPLPIECPHCERVHFWTPTHAWVWRSRRQSKYLDSTVAGRVRRQSGSVSQAIASLLIWFVSYRLRSEEIPAKWA